MIKAYIAHPCRGASGSRKEIKANIEENEKICCAIINDERLGDISPISPLTGFSFFDEDYPESKIMRHCYAMLNGCFDPDWTCRDKQYIVGETYEEETAWVITPPVGNIGLNKFAVVEADDVSPEKADDTKDLKKASL